MKSLIKLFAVVTITLVASYASANTDSDSNLFEQEIEVLHQTAFANPPGSKWISVRCARNSKCYPPAGYNFRHFNTETRGSDCRGSEKRRVKENKNFIQTSRKCSVVGRVFLWPSEYCHGDYKFCQ